MWPRTAASPAYQSPKGSRNSQIHNHEIVLNVLRLLTRSRPHRASVPCDNGGFGVPCQDSTPTKIPTSTARTCARFLLATADLGVHDRTRADGLLHSRSVQDLVYRVASGPPGLNPALESYAVLWVREKWGLSLRT